MAKNEVVMPQMGESITNGTITKWHKSPGDKIELDEILLEISTDKVESEIPSPIEGRVAKILFEEGETIDVGVAIALIEDDPNADLGDTDAGSNAQSSKSDSDNSQQNTDQTASQQQSTDHVVSSQEKNSLGERRFYTPLVKSMAKEAGIDLSELSHIDGSGAGGRVNRDDLLKYISEKEGGAKSSASASTSGSSQSSGQATSSAQPASAPSASYSGRVEVIPMDNMRKAIARNMVESKKTSPHVNSIDEVDMTALVKYREKIKKSFEREEGFKITYTHFIMYAIVQALKEHPLVNSSVDGDNIIVKKDVNLGFAVAVPGNGLMVPVIKGADNLNLRGLCRAVYNLSLKARDKKLTMDDLSGGTYTFTNNGTFGTLMATPVILQPQVGIMACGVIKKRPIVIEDDAMAIRHMMYLTHTYDHRIIDGELGSKFLASVVKNLHKMDPGALL